MRSYEIGSGEEVPPDSMTDVTSLGDKHREFAPNHVPLKTLSTRWASTIGSPFVAALIASGVIPRQTRKCTITMEVDKPIVVTSEYFVSTDEINSPHVLQTIPSLETENPGRCPSERSLGQRCTLAAGHAGNHCEGNEAW